MKVRDLIQLLQAENPDMTVVTDLHSEWAEVQSVKRVSGFDNGGYISAPYRTHDAWRVHGYVYVGVDEPYDKFGVEKP